MLLSKQLVVGPLQCNCHILVCSATKQAVVIDPGDEAQKIVTELTSLGASVKYLLHTHAHFDHIGASSVVKASVGGQISLHRDDDPLYKNLQMQGRFFGVALDEPAPVDLYFEHQQQLHFGELTLEVIHTPGHSPGSVCFRLEQQDIFSGDTLFCRSIGRSDLWGGDANTLLKSIRTRLLSFEDEIKVHPGHGPSTTIGEERRLNPFI